MTPNYPPAISQSTSIQEEAPARTWLIDNGWRTPDTYSNDYDYLPDEPGVYMVVKLWFSESGRRFEILYIGMSTRLNRRINRCHEALIAAENAPELEHGYVFRYFKRFEASEIRRIESEMIRAIKPRLNIIGTKEPVSRRAA